ncbi:hypothetical protein BO71DRAFT_402888 [Aspergillus ellipticus CBS 707.79]|uniref:Uncharacterized protein n=1 Tax=Aspergillus ellipticus CBS 707.79 TaxID=1448320 RepID=A0A319DNE7_9EURO|nr:hypothetical protein BO71DRAFT_402888 [Aspergillus ellipticus CBS 707.79]
MQNSTRQSLDYSCANQPTPKTFPPTKPYSPNSTRNYQTDYPSHSCSPPLTAKHSPSSKAAAATSIYQAAKALNIEIIVLDVPATRSRAPTTPTGARPSSPSN